MPAQAITVRAPERDELKRWMDSGEAAVGGEVREGEVERYASTIDVARQLWAFDGERPVGTCGVFSFTLTIPGGELPAAGVTWVGVQPTHRRRGILTRLMREQLDASRERGEPLAVLWASEAAIYGRFGYGVATWELRVDAERHAIAFRESGEVAASAQLVPLDEARGVVADLYERVRREVPGTLARSPEWWTAMRLADPEHERHGGGPLFCALLEVDGEAHGYALHRLHMEWDSGIPRSRLEVREAVAVSPEATRALWRYLFGVDLVARVRARFLPPDHPLPLAVTDPRRLHAGLGDGLWLRFVDLRAALAARSYAAAGSLVLDVRDSFCDWNTGLWRVEAGDGRADVGRAGGDADLRLDSADLASTYLGGVSFAALREAGRVDEVKPGAVARADALFKTARAPWCPEIF